MDICHDCGTQRNWLHRHHLVPRSEGGNNDPSNIIRICANCHEDRHGGPCGGTSRGRLSATPEAREKKAKTFKRLWSEPEYRERQRLGRENKSWTVEANAKRALAMNRLAKDPAYRAKLSESQKRRRANETPEQRIELGRKVSEAKTKAFAINLGPLSSQSTIT